MCLLCCRWLVNRL